ncbi:MAG: hypothetical protein Q8L79_02630 [Methylobacter sp.]|uniref:hypothetical protein n=1 Tax=Methylobacter sp. TaxID=2051955 RepID=UPI002730B290|nr:hypothetical protein [Methylobacter sp.]MDP1663994.1 hypothetical protein [Methylobacter sp.]
MLLKSNHLKPGDGLGTAKAKDKKEEFLSQIISRLNEIFITDRLTDNDLVNFFYAIRDKIRKNELVMKQIAHNTPEQALLGDFPKAMGDAILDSSAAHQNQMMQLLSDPKREADFSRVMFDSMTRHAAEFPRQQYYGNCADPHCYGAKPEG